jgi:hypothetical protein
MDVLTTPVPTVEAPIDVSLEVYDEAAVDDFLRAVAYEQERLRTEIAAAGTREVRAISLIGMHEAMVTTMRDVCRAVTTTRREAEAQAAATVDEARRRAAEIRAGASR